MMTQVAIIGAGPAGIATAIQLKRYHIEFILFEADQPGGLLKNAHYIENYPGFPRGITGSQLVSLMEEHLDSYGIMPIFKSVEMLEYLETPGKGSAFRLTVPGDVFYAERVVAASGTKPCTLEPLEILLPALKEFVFYEVYPVAGERGKRFLIIGAGDAAFDYALNLSSGNDVVVVNRGEQIKALPLLRERVEASARIRYMENTAVESVDRGVRKVLSVLLSKSNESIVEEFDFVIGAVGREPRRDFYALQLRETLETLKALRLFYEVGDVVSGRFRQASIASGSGICAAMEIAAVISGVLLDSDSSAKTRSLL
jgi:thioredoxin reductase (NADPH)